MEKPSRDVVLNRCMNYKAEWGIAQLRTILAAMGCTLFAQVPESRYAELSDMLTKFNEDQARVKGVQVPNLDAILSGDIEQLIDAPPPPPPLPPASLKKLAGMAERLISAQDQEKLAGSITNYKPSLQPAPFVRKAVTLAINMDEIVALCNDGTMWYFTPGSGRWSELPAIPQDPTADVDLKMYTELEQLRKGETK